MAGSLTGDDFSIALQAARSRPSRGEAKRTMSRMPNASKSSDRARGAIEEAILRNYTPTDADPDSEQGGTHPRPVSRRLCLTQCQLEHRRIQ